MLDQKDIIDMYVNQHDSTYVIAKKYNTYAGKIRRILIKNGIKINSKSEAQLLALKAGRSKHPTAGIKRSEEEKVKISETMHNYWQTISDDQRKKRSEKACQQWQNMTDEQREHLQKSASRAVRKAAKDGSKMEKFLKTNLTEAGFEVLFHKKGLVANQQLELDLYLPALNVVIEVDGPAHFYPIWGEKSLQKHIKADAAKSGLLLAQGMLIIRIKHLISHLSNKHKRDILKDLLIILEKIQKKFPPKGKRFIELEVN